MTPCARFTPLLFIFLDINYNLWCQVYSPSSRPPERMASLLALSVLHNLARNKGKTIVSTIHSPSSEAFFFFDRLILMADGHIVYQGDAKDSVAYFK